MVYASKDEQAKRRIAILGTGNIGLAVAIGLINCGKYRPEQITLTRRRIHLLEQSEKKGFKVTSNNIKAVENSSLIIIAVRPQQIENLLEEITSKLIPQHHILISLVTGITIKQLRKIVGDKIWITRAMPNIAVSIGESMSCLCSDTAPENVIKISESIFNAVGKTLIIEEEYMTPATALCACGIAFFLRSIRAASQGGIEIGFHSEEALLMAAQTAKGAAALLSKSNAHPESEIDKVTTPRGVTISGLNEMEHQGFSSAIIKGIVTSARKAEKLLQKNGA